MLIGSHDFSASISSSADKAVQDRAMNGENHILDFYYNICISAAPPRFRFGGGDTLGGRPRKGSGGGAPRTPENFRTFSKNFLIANNALF